MSARVGCRFPVEVDMVAGSIVVVAAFVVVATVAVMDNRSEVVCSWAAVAVVAGIVDVANTGLVVAALFSLPVNVTPYTLSVSMYYNATL